MKAKDLARLLKEFRDLLKEHYNLWGKSLDDHIPDHPCRNISKLEEQQRRLHQLFYVLNDYLTRYSLGRMMHHPATGMTWDVYRSAIGNDTAPIKGDSIRNALLELEGIIARVESENPEAEIEPHGMATRGTKRIFISHGKESKALGKLERFLRGAGLTPVIVKDEPSRGRALDDLVEEQMASCVCVIVLATRDDKVDERFQPRPNVIHEIGLAQEKVRERIIYLKEEGCDFPSNIAPKVWENFTQENMEDAFLKVIKELRAFRIIE